MSKVFLNMGSTSSKPFQISLNISLKKCDVIQLVAVVKSLLKINANLKSQMIKNDKNTVPKILLFIKLFYIVSHCS